MHTVMCSFTLPADVEVLAETMFLFKGDKSAVVHSWKGYGLKLHVPEGSTADFTARVVHSKSFELPEGTELVSPFYCVTSKGELTGTVGVEIQHCARNMDEKSLSAGLQFAACKVEKTEPPYVFKKILGDFSSSSSYGRSEVEFSGWLFALTKFRKKMLGIKQEFQARIYYEPLTAVTYECRAHLVIVPDTDACQVSAI